MPHFIIQEHKVLNLSETFWNLGLFMPKKKSFRYSRTAKRLRKKEKTQLKIKKWAQ